MIKNSMIKRLAFAGLSALLASQAIYAVASELAPKAEITYNGGTQSVVEYRGDAPEGYRPGGNRPNGNRPEGNRPGGNRPDGNRPGGNRPDGNRPGGNRPDGSRPDKNRPDYQPQGSPVPVLPGLTATPETPELPPKKALSLYVNGKSSDANLYFKGETLLLPLRLIASKGGWNYSYSNGTAILTRGDDVISISSGSKKYIKNGERHSLKTSCEISGGSLYAPWTFFSKALGMSVKIGSEKVTVSGGSSSSSSKSYSLKVNGSKSSAAPYYSGKTLMLPLRNVVEKLGYTYVNDSANRQAIFSAKDVDCFIRWDLNSYPVNNEYVELERKPEIRNNTLYVPASFVSDALQCEVNVSGYKVTVTR